MNGATCLSHPKLSVIIPFYNERRFLRVAAQSLLDERMDSLEVLLVDDGSTDESVKTIEDLPVSYYRNPTNQGRSFARNVGVEKARGEWITFLDGDDLLVPGGIRARVDWLQANESSAGVFGLIGKVIGPDGKTLEAFENRRESKPPAFLSSRFLIDNPNYPASLSLGIFHRTLFERAGRFDEGLSRTEDRDMLIRLLSHGALPVRPIPVLEYRMHDRNLFYHLAGFNSAPAPRTNFRHCEIPDPFPKGLGNGLRGTDA